MIGVAIITFWIFIVPYSQWSWSVAQYANPKYAILARLFWAEVNRGETDESKALCLPSVWLTTEYAFVEGSFLPGRTEVNHRDSSRPLSTPNRIPGAYLITLAKTSLHLPSVFPHTFAFPIICSLQELKTFFLCLVHSLKIYCSFVTRLYQPKFWLPLWSTCHWVVPCVCSVHRSIHRSACVCLFVLHLSFLSLT